MRKDYFAYEWDFRLFPKPIWMPFMTRHWMY